MILDTFTWQLKSYNHIYTRVLKYIVKGIHLFQKIYFTPDACASRMLNVYVTPGVQIAV